MAQFIYAFDHKHRRPPMEMQDLLGDKGANLAEMTSVLELPVPPGFTIATDACREYIEMQRMNPDAESGSNWPKGLDNEIAKAVRRLEMAMGKALGDPSDPLLVSVRPGAKVSMPGMFDTILNLGLNDASVEALAKQAGDDRFAFDLYRRFIATFGRTVLDVPSEPFEERFQSAKELAGVTHDADVPGELLSFVISAYKQLVLEHTGEDFPQDPKVQLRLAVEAAFRTWNGARAVAYRNREGLDHEIGIAVNVQAMVFGNRDENSGAGIGFTRNPTTGERGAYGNFLVNAQGDDVGTGIRNTESFDAMKSRFPSMHRELMSIFEHLERHYRDMCETEFTIEQGQLWMLQTRIGERSGSAALRMAVDMTSDKHIRLSKEEALLRITADDLEVSLDEPGKEFQTILGWADAIRAKYIDIRANADNVRDAKVARGFGASGIGLCRTEHMFIADDRLPIVREIIMAATPDDEQDALEALRKAQKTDFLDILEAMDGLPVTVRLLDPPLHEFLPSTAELELREATVGLSDEQQRLYEAAKAWEEVNPGFGIRGVRLAVLKPQLYSMQVRALMEAAAERVAAGGRPILEIMIPQTASREEMALAREWVEEAIDIAVPSKKRIDVTVGTVIETPRAALRADEIAEEAEFFSFGTNDLTQMTYGFSRDDVEGSLMTAYLEKGLLPHNPFQTIDQDGVGELIRIAIERGRDTNPRLKIGVCGEHSGDVDSIAMFVDAGVDYVSCSPSRVAIARLATAQAILTQD